MINCARCGSLIRPDDKGCSWCAPRYAFPSIVTIALHALETAIRGGEVSAAYMKSTSAMAKAIGGTLYDLAGGCWGVALPVDGGTLVLARCPDLGGGHGYVGYATWSASIVDADGETLLPRAGDQAMADFGFVRPRDYADAPRMALKAIIAEARR